MKRISFSAFLKAFPMKIMATLLVAFSFCTFQAVAGVPRKMAYQIMALDPTTGQVLANREVNIRIELRKDTTNGPAVWYQDFKVQTDEAGVCQLTLELADSISWGAANYYMATIVDGKECGAPQITSVPYAMQAARLENVFTPLDLIGSWKALTGDEYVYTFKSDHTVTISADGEEARSYQWLLDAAGHLLIYRGNSCEYIYSVVKISDTSIAFGDYIYQKQ